MLPWAEMMRAALAAGVPVSDFWMLSLREWRWLSEGARAHKLSFKELAELMNTFPDEEDENGRI
jgi:hypothetical protein